MDWSILSEGVGLIGGCDGLAGDVLEIPYHSQWARAESTYAPYVDQVSRWLLPAVWLLSLHGPLL